MPVPRAQGAVKKMSQKEKLVDIAKLFLMWFYKNIIIFFENK